MLFVYIFLLHLVTLALTRRSSFFLFYIHYSLFSHLCFSGTELQGGAVLYTGDFRYERLDMDFLQVLTRIDLQAM